MLLGLWLSAWAGEGWTLAVEGVEDGILRPGVEGHVVLAWTNDGASTVQVPIDLFERALIFADHRAPDERPHGVGRGFGSSPVSAADVQWATVEPGGTLNVSAPLSAVVEACAAGCAAGWWTLNLVEPRKVVDLSDDAVWPDAPDEVAFTVRQPHTAIGPEVLRARIGRRDGTVAVRLSHREDEPLRVAAEALWLSACQWDGPEGPGGSNMAVGGQARHFDEDDAPELRRGRARWIVTACPVPKGARVTGVTLTPMNTFWGTEPADTPPRVIEGEIVVTR